MTDPLGVVAVTLTSPGSWADVRTLTREVLRNFVIVAGEPPKSTAMSPVKLLPNIQVVDPPSGKPLLGDMVVISGGAVV